MILKEENIYEVYYYNQEPGDKPLFQIMAWKQTFLEKTVVKTYVTVNIYNVKRHYMLNYTCISNILFL